MFRGNLSEADFSDKVKEKGDLILLLSCFNIIYTVM